MRIHEITWVSEQEYKEAKRKLRDEMAEKIERYQKEIEWEETYSPTRLNAALRHIMNMSPEESKAFDDELDYKIRKMKQHQRQKAHQEQRAMLKQQQLLQAEQQAHLDGIRAGAAEVAKTKVKQMADRQLKRVLKK